MRPRIVAICLLAAVLAATALAEAQTLQRAQPRQPEIRREILRPELVPHDRLRLRRDLYFADCRESPGAVYHVQATKTVLYKRSSGNLSGFAFAPWDLDRLYFTNGNDNKVFMVDLSAATPTEIVVYTHTTYVRDVAFDSSGRLYFSEATGAGANGSIYRLDGGGSASVYFTVQLSQIDGYWAGDFGFAPDGTLLLSSGNRIPSSIYEADIASGVLTKLYDSASEAVTGFAHNPAEAFFYTNHKTRIYTLDFDVGAPNLAYEDTAQQWICDVGFRDSGPAIAPGVGGNWVMPYGIRGFRIDQIKTTGLIDYVDGLSGLAMKDAPFGGNLLVRLNSSSSVPTPQVYYYRLRYRREGSPLAWTDFDTPVNVRYVKYGPGLTWSFPNLSLGPTNIGGKNLYRFRPHEWELPALTGFPAGTVKWPKNPLPGDVYRGSLNTVVKALAPGRYQIRVEVYTNAGSLTPPAAYQMIVPTGVSGNTITAAPAPLVGGGFQFRIHVDNRATEGEFHPPKIGTTLTDACGFLRYDPAAPGQVHLAWRAWHPAEFAVYRLRLYKGANALGSLPLPGSSTAPLPFTEEVASSAHHGDGAGNFWEDSPTLALLGGCREAAYAARLYVFAKATTGNGHRIHQYDSSDLDAFAIAPEPPVP